MLNLEDKPHYFDEINDDILLVHRHGEGYKGAFHKHNGYEIYLFIQGNTDFIIEDTTTHMKRGSIAIINPSEYHLAICLDNSYYERYTLNISPRLLRHLSTEKTNLISFFENKQSDQNIITVSEEKITQLLELYTLLDEALKQTDFCSDILVYSTVMQILYFVTSNYIKSTDINVNIMPAVIAKTIQYINDHIAEKITLSCIEAELNFNKDYIGRQFKQYTGIPLKNYILEKKIHLAGQLLAQGQSVTEVCLNTGFNDYANFIRTYKRHTGLTPGKYKQSQPYHLSELPHES